MTARMSPASSSEMAIRLGDGSIVTPADPQSRVVTKSVSPHLIEVELAAGSALFDVTPDRERQFRVSAGPVVVLVLGTRFTVTRQGDVTQVAVQRGQVRVEWERGQQILNPGERGSFPPIETTIPVSPEAHSPGSEKEVPALQPRPSSGRPGPDWRALARQGDFPSAYRLMQAKTRAGDFVGMDDLLLAADVARGAGHAAESIPYLTRALALHAHNSQAALAAFSLGRVLQTDMHDPAGAAAAFAQARALDPSGPLAEDAVAREAEAWFRAGEKAKARQAAEEYEKSWPTGTRLRAVRHFGGL
jgi:transmembrane sensor